HGARSAKPRRWTPPQALDAGFSSELGRFSKFPITTCQDAISLTRLLPLRRVSPRFGRHFALSLDAAVVGQRKLASNARRRLSRHGCLLGRKRAFRRLPQASGEFLPANLARRAIRASSAQPPSD